MRQTVQLAMAIGYTQEQAARLIGVGLNTLTKHYREEIDKGAEKVLAAVAGNLVTIATQQQDRKAALTACIFICKTRLGWRDRDPFEAKAESKMEADGTVTVTLKLGDKGDAEA